MSRPTRSRSQLPVSIFASAIAAAALVAFAASPLPRITPDAAVYLTGAETLANTGEFRSCERAITEYAPGYPAAIALFVSAGLDAPDGARTLNVLATFVLVLAAAGLARGVGLGTTGATLVSLAVATAPATLRNGAAAWSEPVFSALLAVLLVAVVNGGRGLDARPSGRLVLVVGLTWALLMTRYSGLLVLPGVILAASLGSRRSSRRTFRVLAFSFALLAGPSLWYARNISLDAGPFGSRSASDFSFVDVLRQLPDGLSSIVVPVDVPLAIRIAVLVPVILVAALALPRRSRPPGERLASAVLGAIVLGYVAGIAYAAMRTRLDPVDARLLSPILVPWAVLVAVGVTRSAGVIPPGVHTLVRAGAVALVACTTAIAPWVASYLHDAERKVVLDFPVTCADWPSRYESLSARSGRDRGRPRVAPRDLSQRAAPRAPSPPRRPR